MKNGAQDYLLKPFDPDELGVLIERVLGQQAQNRENQYLREQVKDRARFESIIGQSPPMQEIFDLINSVAPSDATVLITGETGTGKGLAARRSTPEAIAARAPLSRSTVGPSPST
jgi:DNA-binding NtrC family response regulator